ncbi:hypothetical protein OG756_41400 (plasmid) [Streptomyces sp. NBC_01310]|uniref:hypothetical protein n=1 Tax=Streptomyces TaxID=1883 RepID=UPI002254F4BB|nr:hypothetical protein [Streptomyces virginiae]MCX5278070.1 hypothetical protein [Streptomyces virginiae]WSJ64476.1 hypothetical protein OG756_41400 [Streptomyces sp. NBC_01310]
MYAKIRQRLTAWYWRPLRLQWWPTKYLCIEVDRHLRDISLNQVADLACPKCEGRGYLPEWRDYDEVPAGDCPVCPMPRLLARIAWGPRKPVDYTNEPPF